MYAENVDLLSGKSSHDLRRSFAQRGYDRTSGNDIEKMREICKALGHSPDRDDITARYLLTSGPNNMPYSCIILILGVFHNWEVIL
jgi:integrase